MVAIGGTVSRATFVGTGAANALVSLSIAPAPSITLTRVGGTETMTVNQVRVSVNGGSPQPTGPNHNLSAGGLINFALGGRLNITATQAPGTYNGTISVTMNYQ